MKIIAKYLAVKKSFFFFVPLLILILLSSCFVIKNGGAESPNVIFILVDDMGYGDLGVTGHPYIITPNLDRLAKEGTRFTQFYSNASVCSPSRVAFMTGLFPARNNVHHIYTTNEERNRKRGVPNFLDPNVLTVADVMKQAGYSTGHVGKWHLDGTQDSPLPRQYGFDHWRITNGLLQSEIFEKRFASTEHEFNKSSNWIIDDGIDFIEKSKASGQPFYLQLWTLVPHAILYPTPEELAVYNGLNAKPEDFTSWMRSYAASTDNLASQMKIYAASVTSLDAAIGRLLDYLDLNGLSENTLIFFTSDNGPEDYHVRNARNAGMGSPGLFRGRKRSIYDGGIHVPAIVRWPGYVPSGEVSDRIVSGVDWLPTIAEIIGVKLPEDYQPDGEDISGIFYGNQEERRKSLFWEWKFPVIPPGSDQDFIPPQLAIRQGGWKFLINPDGSNPELYNVQEDPGERMNLQAMKPDIVEELSTILLEWKGNIPESAYSEKIQN